MAAAQDEFIKALTTALTTAIQTVTSQQRSGQGGNTSGSAQQPKVQSFSFSEYRSLENSSVEDYFKRFEWA